MKVQHFVLAPDQHEPALSVLGTQVTILASNAATQSYGITLCQKADEKGSDPLFFPRTIGTGRPRTTLRLQ